MFAIFDAYPLDLKTFMQHFHGILPPDVVLSLALYILDGLMFLEEHDIAHWDVKMDNFFVSRACGVVFLADLGEALLDLVRSRRLKLPVHSRFAGGNPVHRVPEVLKAISPFSKVGGVPVDVDLPVLGQATFEAAMVIAAVLLRREPIIAYPTQSAYKRGDVCKLGAANARAFYEAGYTDELLELLRDGLDFDPTKRPSLRVFRDKLIRLLEPCVAALQQQLVAASGTDVPDVASAREIARLTALATELQLRDQQTAEQICALQAENVSVCSGSICAVLTIHAVCLNCCVVDSFITGACRRGCS